MEINSLNSTYEMKSSALYQIATLSFLINYNNNLQNTLKKSLGSVNKNTFCDKVR